VVFKLDLAGKQTVLYSFTGRKDGNTPEGLIRDPAGNLYGTTFYGGDRHCGLYRNGCGVVFEVNKDGKETVLHTFTGTDGDVPVGLIRDETGNFFGVTYSGGGLCGGGVVFKLDAVGKETVLYNFTVGSDGMDPEGGVILDESGNLYGTAVFGGDSSCGYQGGGCGVVFKLTP
jgi:uncharacterized repeat protein (TIGR03803 family)